MGRVPDTLRQTVAKNLRHCRESTFSGRGGAKTCAEAFGVSPQQWSLWECGIRMPDEKRMRDLADFFGVTVESLRADGHRSPTTPDKSAIASGNVQPAITRELLDHSNKLIGLLMSVRNDALAGKRDHKAASEVMRQTNHYVEYLLRDSNNGRKANQKEGQPLL